MKAVNAPALLIAMAAEVMRRATGRRGDYRCRRAPSWNSGTSHSSSGEAVESAVARFMWLSSMQNAPSASKTMVHSSAADRGTNRLTGWAAER